MHQESTPATCCCIIVAVTHSTFKIIFSTGLSFDPTFLPCCRFHTLSFLRTWVKEKSKCKLFFVANDGWPFPNGELEMVILIKKKENQFFDSVSFLQRKYEKDKLLQTDKKTKFVGPQAFVIAYTLLTKCITFDFFFFPVNAVPKRNPPFAT